MFHRRNSGHKSFHDTWCDKHSLLHLLLDMLLQPRKSTCKRKCMIILEGEKGISPKILSSTNNWDFINNHDIQKVNINSLNFSILNHTNEHKATNIDNRQTSKKDNQRDSNINQIVKWKRRKKYDTLSLGFH